MNLMQVVCRELGHRYLFSALQTYQFTLGAANLSADGVPHAGHIDSPALTGVSCVGNEVRTSSMQNYPSTGCPIWSCT